MVTWLVQNFFYFMSIWYPPKSGAWVTCPTLPYCTDEIKFTNIRQTIKKIYDNREDAESRTRGIFHCDSMKHKVILHWITMKCAVSRMKMPRVRDSASSLLVSLPTGRLVTWLNVSKWGTCYNMTCASFMTMVSLPTGLGMSK